MGCQLTQKLIIGVICLTLLLVELDASPRHHNRSNRNRGRHGRRRTTTTDAPSPASPSPEEGASCPGCMDRNFRKFYRIEQFKSDVLRKLNLEAPVNVTNRTLPQIPPIYANPNPQAVHSRLTSKDPDVGVTLRVFPIAEPIPESFHVNYSNSFYFRFGNDVLNAYVTAAKLGIYIRSTRQASNIRTYILIYLIEPPSSRNPEVTRRLLYSPSIRLNSEQTGRWYVSEFTDIVRRWVVHPETNLGLHIVCTDWDGRSLALVQPEDESEDAFKPYLDVSIRQQHASTRSKRMLGLDCDESSSESRCCRYPLLIDFGSYNWDFIIAPKHYSAFYCSGDCPFSYYQKYPHSYMITHARPQGSGGPCCVPEQLSGISLIYFDRDLTVKLDQLEDMVVERCDCIA